MCRCVSFSVLCCCHNVFTLQTNNNKKYRFRENLNDNLSDLCFGCFFFLFNFFKHFCCYCNLFSQFVCISNILITFIGILLILFCLYTDKCAHEQQHNRNEMKQPVHKHLKNSRSAIHSRRHFCIGTAKQPWLRGCLSTKNAYSGSESDINDSIIEEWCTSNQRISSYYLSSSRTHGNLASHFAFLPLSLCLSIFPIPSPLLSSITIGCDYLFVVLISLWI